MGPGDQPDGGAYELRRRVVGGTVLTAGCRLTQKTLDRPGRLTPFSDRRCAGCCLGARSMSYSVHLVDLVCRESQSVVVGAPVGRGATARTALE